VVVRWSSGPETAASEASGVVLVHAASTLAASEKKRQGPRRAGDDVGRAFIGLSRKHDCGIRAARLGGAYVRGVCRLRTHAIRARLPTLVPDVCAVSKWRVPACRVFSFHGCGGTGAPPDQEPAHNAVQPARAGDLRGVTDDPGLATPEDVSSHSEAGAPEVLDAPDGALSISANAGDASSAASAHAEGPSADCRRARGEAGATTLQLFDDFEAAVDAVGTGYELACDVHVCVSRRADGHHVLRSAISGTVRGLVSKLGAMESGMGLSSRQEASPGQWHDALSAFAQ
jgi:hypothetical protein